MLAARLRQKARKMTEHLQVKFASSEIDADTGVFKGYGAVFGNIDSHSDVIMPGAFKKSLEAWEKRGKYPAMKLMHGYTFFADELPVGKWTKMAEDANGLYVEGKISGLDTDLGKRVYGLMKDGVLDGLSIGYRPTKSRSGSGDVKRYLDEIDLREVSIVDEPSNDMARVKAVKSKFNPREIEDALRDAGLSRADSVKAVAVFKSALRDEGEDPRDEDEEKQEAGLSELTTFIKSLTHQ